MAISDKLELHFVSDNQILNSKISAVEKFTFSMSLGLAKYYSDAISDNVRRANEKLRNQGVVNKFPEGYIRQNGQVNTTDSSELISEAFSLFSSGRYNQAELCELLNKKGFKTNTGKKLTRQTLNKILNNPFYCGLAKSKYGNYQHIYKPLTTKTIFDKCQDILNQNTKSSRKQKRGFRPYPFRNLLTCSECDRTINPYTAKQKYNYYRCVNKECQYYQEVIKEEILLKQAETVLKNLVFPNEAIEFIVDKLKNDFNQESLYQKQKRAEIYREKEKLEAMRNNLLDKYLDPNSSITDSIYTEKDKELESKIYELNLQLTQETKETTDLHLTVSSLFNLINRLPEIFKSSNSTEKNQILKYLISNSLQTGQKAEFNLKKPFLFLYQNQSNQCWFGDRDSNSG